MSLPSTVEHCDPFDFILPKQFKILGTKIEKIQHICSLGALGFLALVERVAQSKVFGINELALTMPTGAVEVEVGVEVEVPKLLV